MADLGNRLDGLTLRILIGFWFGFSFGSLPTVGVQCGLLRLVVERVKFPPPFIWT